MTAMHLEDYRPFFNPDSILLIGASRNEYTFNGVVLKNLLDARYRGKITIIHPYSEEIMGVRCFPTLNDLPEELKAADLAIILTQHDIVDTLQKLAEQNVTHIMIETDLSVKNDPIKKAQLYREIKAIVDRYNLKMLGPSMIGIIDFPHSFTTSVIPTRSHILRANRAKKSLQGVSFLAQSGGLSGACGWWNPIQIVPFSKVIHIGECIGITEAEMLEYLFLDSSTKIIILYIKEVTAEFLQILSKYRKHKPVLFKFVGKLKSQQTKLREVGAIEVRNYIELFEFAKVLLWCPPPSKSAVGIIGPSSGAINLLIAEMRENEIHLANLDPQNREFILEKVGGSTCALGNPVDFWPPREFVGTQVCNIYHNASSTLLADSNVGALFLALEFFTEIEFNFSIFQNIKEKFPDKPIICILIQAEKEGAERVLEIAGELNIPVFIDEVERGVRALKCLIDYYETD